MNNDELFVPVYTVTELNSVLNQTLQVAYPEIALEGEVANFKINQNKWVFFDLKDDNCIISCFMSIYQLKTPIEDGMMLKVYCTAKITNWGKFSLTIRTYELSGEGSVKKAFELLKEKLSKEGLFQGDRKRALPEFVNKIALITSTGAAAYNDFLTILGKRWSGVQIDHINVQVQGADAPTQIRLAIEHFNSLKTNYDCLVLIRGGGSPEDLQAFQTEEVVRALYSSNIPTVVGIGHEDDVCLAELVADVRAATPTDAARIVVPDKIDFMDYLDRLGYGFYQNIKGKIQHGRSSIDRFEHLSRMFLIDRINILENKSSIINERMTKIINNEQARLDIIGTKLEILNPSFLLKRGFSIVRSGSKIIRSTDDLKIGQNVVIQLQKGKMVARIKEFL